MTGAACSRTGCAKAIAVLLLLASRPPGPEPVHGQDAATYSPAESAVSPAGVLGPWILDEELSEDPVLEAAQAAREGGWTSSIRQEEAGRFTDRRESILIGVEDDSVLLLDGRGDTRAFPLGGAWRSFAPGIQHRAIGRDDTLSIETIANDWLGVDTFVREQEQLLRATHLRSRRLDNVGLRFRTVYERPATGSTSDRPASNHPFVDTARGFARPATILIVPPERGYRQLLSGRVQEGDFGHGSLAGRTSGETLLREQARRRLRRISRHTGGRHFHVDLVAHDTHWTHRIEGAFRQIEQDLRHQHMLTYYTEQPPDAPTEPEIRVTRRELKLRSAVPLWTTE